MRFYYISLGIVRIECTIMHVGHCMFVILNAQISEKMNPNRCIRFSMKSKQNSLEFPNVAYNFEILYYSHANNRIINKSGKTNCVISDVQVSNYQIHSKLVSCFSAKDLRTNLLMYASMK